MSICVSLPGNSELQEIREDDSYFLQDIYTISGTAPGKRFTTFLLHDDDSQGKAPVRKTRKDLASKCGPELMLARLTSY